MSSNFVASRSTLERVDPPDPLIATLRKAKGETSFVAFAAKVLHTESMLRLFMTGKAEAGYDTLCILLDWKPSLANTILARMRAHGKELRARTRAKYERVDKAA